MLSIVHTMYYVVPAIARIGTPLPASLPNSACMPYIHLRSKSLHTVREVSFFMNYNLRFETGRLQDWKILQFCTFYVFSYFYGENKWHSHKKVDWHKIFALNYTFLGQNRLKNNIVSRNDLTHDLYIKILRVRWRRRTSIDSAYKDWETKTVGAAWKAFPIKGSEQTDRQEILNDFHT